VKRGRKGKGKRTPGGENHHPEIDSKISFPRKTEHLIVLREKGPNRKPREEKAPGGSRGGNFKGCESNFWGKRRKKPKKKRKVREKYSKFKKE